MRVILFSFFFFFGKIPRNDYRFATLYARSLEKNWKRGKRKMVKEFQFPPPLTESYLHKGGRAIRRSRRGRWTDSKWSIKLEISEHTVYTVNTRTWYSWSRRVREHSIG